MCRSHQEWLDRGTQPDSFYERKIVEGLTVPTWDYLSASEAHALLNGRYRGDGRRIDQYVIDQPLGVDPESFGRHDEGHLDVAMLWSAVRAQLACWWYRVRGRR